MAIYEFEGRRPRIGRTSYVHPSAVIIGDVEIGEGCWIGPQVSIRADVNSIRIADKSNLQDNVVVHGNTTLGEYSHIGHAAVLHGCTLQEHVLVAINAVVLDGVKVGEWSVIAAGAVVAPRAEIPAYSMVMGVPASVVGTVPAERKVTFSEEGAYLTFPARYPENLIEISLDDAHGISG